MTSPTDPRPDAFFVGDHLAMDYLNSVAMPAGERIEWLVNSADLVNWLLQAGAIDAKIAKRFRSENTRARRHTSSARITKAGWSPWPRESRAMC